MVYRVLAEIVLALHVCFVLFVVGGGLLVPRWRRLAWLHLPSAAWGAWVELAGWICPLTPVESWLRRRAGLAGYESGWLEHYLGPILYPPALGRELQWLRGGGGVLVNAGVYLWVLRRRARVVRRSRR